MNVFQKLARKIIKKSFDHAVKTIAFFNNMEPYKAKVEELKKLEEGTLGKEIAQCLERYNLTLVPNFESHDLKHVLLDYQMTAEGEIRLQAFMIGNRNYTIPSFAILIFGMLLLPDVWKTFYSDFKKGRNAVDISSWTIEDYSSRNLYDIRNQLTRPKVEKEVIFSIQQITKFGAIAAITAGVFGMLFCLPFLFSSNMADLVGAGFPFMGGAILAVGGLLTLSNLSRANESQHVTI